MPSPPPPLTDADIDALQALLDAVPAPLEPLDVSALDGFLAGVALQRPAPPEAQWLPLLTDVDARPLPRGCDATPLHALARRRYAELDAAVGQRRWFDPWVFELDADAPPSHAVVGWVAGFALAMQRFPALLERAGSRTVEPLALLYRHLDADDLDDADALLAEIDTLEPPADLAEAVEDLVQAVLLLADLSRPLAQRRRGNPASATAPTRRRGPRPRR